MDHGAPGEGHVSRVTILAVLSDRMLNVLSRQLVLQLSGRCWDPVHQQGKVERALTPGLVPQLTRHCYTVRFVLQL